MILRPDYVYAGSKETLELMFRGLVVDLSVPMPHWIETATDTTLIDHCGEGFEISVWNETGVRAKLSTLLGLPVVRLQ